MAEGRESVISLEAKVYGFNEAKPKQRKVVYRQMERSPGYALYLYSGGKIKQKVEVTRQSVRGHLLNSQLSSQTVRRIRGLGGRERQEFNQVTSLVLLYESSPFVLQVTSRMNNTSANGKALKKLAERLDKELEQVATCQVNIQENDCINYTGLAQIYLTENHLCLSNRAVSLLRCLSGNTPTVLATWPWDRVCEARYVRMLQSTPVGLTLRVRTEDNSSTESLSFTCQNAEDLYTKFQTLAVGGDYEVLTVPPTTPTPPSTPTTPSCPLPPECPPPLIREKPREARPPPPARYPSRESADLYINWRKLNSIYHQIPVYHTRSLEYLPACDGRLSWGDSPLVRFVRPTQDYLSLVSPTAPWIAPHRRTLSLSVDDLRRCPTPPSTLPNDDTYDNASALQRHPDVSDIMKTTSRGSFIPANQTTHGQDVIAQSFQNWCEHTALKPSRGFSGDQRSPQHETGARSMSEYDENSIYHPLPNLVRILASDHRHYIPNRLLLSDRARQDASLRLNKSGPDDQGASWEDLAYAIGLCVDTVDFIKKYVYHRRRDYYEAELVLKFWEYYGNDASPLQLEPCTWAKLVDLLKQLDRYDVADRLIYQRQQRQ